MEAASSGATPLTEVVGEGEGNGNGKEEEEEEEEGEEPEAADGWDGVEVLCALRPAPESGGAPAGPVRALQEENKTTAAR